MSTRPIARSASPLLRSSDGDVARDAAARSRTSCSTSAPTSPRRARISRDDMRCASSQPQVDRLEDEIDAMNARLEPLTSFILPGRLDGACRSSTSPAPSSAAPSAQRSRSHEAEPLNPLRAGLSQPPVRPSVRRRAPRRRRAKAATCCGNPARRADLSARRHTARYSIKAAAWRLARSDERQSEPRRAARRDAAADARPRRAAVATPTRRSSRFPTPRRPNGTSPTRPGSSRPSSCATMSPGYRPFDERFALPVQQLLRGRGRAACAAQARHAQPPVARRGPRLARACRRGARHARCPSLPPAALELVELGINHEQQHQELFLTDILATFAENPLEPAYGELAAAACFATEPLSLHPRPRRAWSRSARATDGFAFDCERPRHQRLAPPARASPTAASPTANGASSSPTAAIARRPCG